MSRSVEELLRELAGRDDPGEAWQPLYFAGDDDASFGRLGELASQDAASFVYDTLLDQIKELVETRHPAQDFTPEALAEAARAHLAGRDPARYGVWVYYPWSRRLVHVLPEAEYRELRTSRNRNKITLEEQNYLRSLRLGVVGLSVGQATAITLVMEEVGGEYLLADFDRLALSNMNRLRVGAHTIGINKAVVTAREIFELNPYARVAIFPAGLDDDNLDVFLSGGADGRRLDLLFEECDDLFMKVRLRERARAHGIAVLMETSDKGLFDIERFDKERERPIFHGLLAGVDAERLRGLSTLDKVPYVLKIIGSTSVSPRLGASLVEVKTSIKTWPQLASAVALGAAINTDVARRVALGALQGSGRFYVDLEELVRDGAQVDLSAQLVPEDTTPPPQAEVPAPPRQARLPLSHEDVRALVAHAALAPSGGNCQPWRFVYRAGKLVCRHDLERSRSFLDYAHRATHMAFGAMLENLELAAEQMGLSVTLQTFPDPDDPLLVCEVGFDERAAPPRDSVLFDQITRRASNRRLGAREPLSSSDADALAGAAMARGARLSLLEAPEQLEAMATILGRGDRVRLLDYTTHHEMMSELRWTTAEALRTRDGLDVRTLELSAADLAGMRIASSWRIMEMVGRLGGGFGLAKSSKKAIAAAAAVGLVTVPGTSPEDYLRGGRAVQRVWLTATARGLAFQPMTAINYLWARLLDDKAGLPEWAAEELGHLRQLYRELFDVQSGHAEPMLFRLAKADPPTARSLRRRVEDMLTIEDS